MQWHIYGDILALDPSLDIYDISTAGCRHHHSLDGGASTVGLRAVIIQGFQTLRQLGDQQPVTAGELQRDQFSRDFLVGGWALPLWKIWVRQLGWWNSQYGKITNVPNHQPAFDLFQKDPTHVPCLALPIIPSKRWCIFSYVVLSRYLFMAIHRKQGVTRVPPKLSPWAKTNAESIVHGVQLFRRGAKYQYDIIISISISICIMSTLD